MLLVLAIAPDFGDNRRMDHQTTPSVTDSAPSAPRLTLRVVVHEAAKRLFDMDRGWLRTARDLTLEPGAMIRRYVQYDRKTYANPFAYLVFGTAASFMVQKMIGFNDRIVAAAGSNTLDSPLQMEFVNRFTELVLQNSLYISFGILIPMALLVRIFFWGSGYNFAESFVFALYTIGHTALLGCVLVPLYMLLPPSAAIQGIVPVAVAIIYLVYAARGYFRGGFISVAIKTSAAFLIAYAAFMVMMMACVFAYIVIVMVPSSPGVDWDLVTATDYEAVPVIEKLLDEGADVNMTRQRTALHSAAATGNLEIVELLLGRGADVNLQDISGRVPMFVALAEHQPEVARRLADAETDPNVRTSDGSTLLMAAVRAENVGLVQWALDHGTEINAIRPTKNHATALMIAAGKGNLDIVNLLLANEADPDVTNHKGLKALDLAKGDEVKKTLRAAVKFRSPAIAPAEEK